MFNVRCLSIGTPNTTIFPFVPNGKFIILTCPKIWAHYSLIIMCLYIGTPNNHLFPFGTNGKEVVLGVPILKHFRVSICGGIRCHPVTNCYKTSSQV